MKNIIPIIYVIVFLAGCSNDYDLPTGALIPAKRYDLSGKIKMENQVEFSNCAIYDSAMTMLASSDSGGNYVLNLSDYYDNFTGTMTLYYFLIDYDYDSVLIYLKNGQVQTDTLDVDENRIIRTVYLEQLFKIECRINKATIDLWDSLEFTAKYINTSDDKRLYFTFPYDGGSFFPVYIYKGPNFNIGFGNFISNIGLPAESIFEIGPGESFILSKKEIFPGKLDGGLRKISPGKYILKPSTLYGLDDKKMRNAPDIIYSSWDEYHRGKLPCYPYPQKLNLVKITVTSNIKGQYTP